MPTSENILSLKSIPQDPDETLLYFDSPLLMWLEATDGRIFLAHALIEEDYPMPFILFEVSEEVYDSVNNKEMTFREACDSSETKYLLKDYSAKKLKITELADIPDEWYPGDVYKD